MNRRGRDTLMLMAGMLALWLLSEGWEHVRPFFIDLCNAGQGGCK